MVSPRPCRTPRPRRRAPCTSVRRRWLRPTRKASRSVSKGLTPVETWALFVKAAGIDPRRFSLPPEKQPELTSQHIPQTQRPALACAGRAGLRIESSTTERRWRVPNLVTCRSIRYSATSSIFEPLVRRQGRRGSYSPLSEEVSRVSTRYLVPKEEPIAAIAGAHFPLDSPLVSVQHLETDLRDQLQATLSDAYRLERELGGGGMSRVFLAEERALGRRVVVKVLSPDLAAGINFERFKREILLTAQLQHPHIVPVFTAGETDGLPYYTMPFVEGESLRVRLMRTGAMPIALAVSILRDVARALAFAHSKGVVHRDIKPDNILLAGNTATVSDFGIAKALLDSRTATPAAPTTDVGVAIGTPQYMAPEQAAADAAIDQRVDLYALGCVAYEMVAGELPFAGRSAVSFIRAHLDRKS